MQELIETVDKVMENVSHKPLSPTDYSVAVYKAITMCRGLQMTDVDLGGWVWLERIQIRLDEHLWTAL